MFLKEFYEQTQGSILIEAQQASHFAKRIAGDFNPLHDDDSKRFCVPGDLLCSIVLQKYGLSNKMLFTFSGMVGKDVLLNFPQTDADNFSITDDKGKSYLHVERSGEIIKDEQLIEAFIRQYVAFSGRNFPHVLVPLMAEQNVMINTERPLVIYDSMSFELQTTAFRRPELEASESTLDLKGKRGDAHLHYNIKCNSEIIGHGTKKIVISGIRDYEHDTITDFTDNYLARMSAYREQMSLET